MRHELDAREYKLLLNPDRFQKTPSEIVANTFWQERLKPIIQKLGDRDGEARHDGRFGAPSERIVRFWDTPTCLLTQADFALRERLPAENGTPVSQQPEITLKLRMPDLFVVAATALPGTGGDPRTTLEEDIAPLEVDDPQQDKTSVIVPVNVRSAVVFHSPPPRPPIGANPMALLAACRRYFQPSPTTSHCYRRNSDPAPNWSAAGIFMSSCLRVLV